MRSHVFHCNVTRSSINRAIITDMKRKKGTKDRDKFSNSFVFLSISIFILIYTMKEIDEHYESLRYVHVCLNGESW